MTDKKYKIRKDLSIKFEGHTLYRIEALRNISYDVDKGDIGGFVEDEYNLSRDFDCWIYNDAKVFGEASIYNNAVILNNAIVKNHAIVDTNCVICGNAILDGYVHIRGNVTVCDNAQILNTAYIFDDVVIRNNVIIKDDAFICGHARIYGDVVVSNNALIDGEACIQGNMKISDTNDVIVIGPIGPNNNYITFINQEGIVYVNTESFFDTIEKFKHEIKTTYSEGLSNIQYYNAIDYIEKHFKDYNYYKTVQKIKNIPYFGLTEEERILVQEKEGGLNDW